MPLCPSHHLFGGYGVAIHASQTRWRALYGSQIRKQLDTMVSLKSKLTKQVKKPKATWVEPKFFASVEYRDITSEGIIYLTSTGVS
jgi:bifunctional non-homologous end joining protein LigD